MNNPLYHDIAAQIRSRIGPFEPDTLIILGSGLGALGHEIANPVIINYADLKGFPQSTVSGHEGRLIIGSLCGHNVICMQGRIHLYEGHDPQSINTIIKAFQILGIKQLIVTNAAGSLNPQMAPGSIMLIKDHINFSGRNPLAGYNDDALGPRFPDLSNAYDADIRHQVHQLAHRHNIELFDGVYLMVLGPNFETAAEIRAFRTLGADAVGMSTVPEVLCAVHSGMKVLGLSVITNFGTGMKEGTQSHSETLAQANSAAQKLTTLVKCYLQENPNG